ncbi:putative HSP20-like chaperone [Rosa chinensis]|uniref:Putative HSP20-like chaperone n=1 Tax=Rosa chinensis TaxID=74649 RepID=A0A2P6P2G0_ROSCH|nr:inactive protein RESTRICTED TEV MOVEMENT 2 [Rosa chinensis]PRQ16110.1 putative HSP20-like chaperone [Rosa chinensis]
MANVRGRTSGMHRGERLSTFTPTRVKIVPGSGWTEDSNGHYLLVDLEGFNKEKVKLEVNTTEGHLTVTGERQVNVREHVYIEENFPIPANSDVDKITGKFDGEILYVTVPKVVAVVQENKEPEIVEAKEPEIIVAKKEPEMVEAKMEPEIVQPKKEPEIVQEKQRPEIIENQKVEAVQAAENTHLRAPKNNDGKYRDKYDGTNDAQPNRLLGNARIYFSPENIRKWEEDKGILRSAMEVLSKNKGMVITAIVAFSLGMLISQKFKTGE